MWTAYHGVRTSKTYCTLWASLISNLAVKTSPVFCQYVGHVIFKELITKHYRHTDQSIDTPTL